MTLMPFCASAQKDTLNYFDIHYTNWHTTVSKKIYSEYSLLFCAHLSKSEEDLIASRPECKDSLIFLSYQGHLDWIDEQHLEEYPNWTGQKYLDEHYKPRLTKANHTPSEMELLLHTKPLKVSMFPKYLWVEYFTVRLAADYMNKPLLDSIKTIGHTSYDRIMSKKGKDRDFYVFLERSYRV